MLKNLSSLQVVVEDKQFVFSCDQDASLSAVYHSLSQMKAYVFDLIKQHQKSEESLNETVQVDEIVPSNEVL